MLIDSNILIYAINKSSPKHKQAINFLKNSRFDMVVSHQNILETIRILTHPKYSYPMKPKLASDAVLKIANACRIISPNNTTYHIILEYIKKFGLCGNRIFDGYLAATALSNGVYEIATDNTKDFQKFTQVKLTNPFKS